jgi:hypothetical protein
LTLLAKLGSVPVMRLSPQLKSVSAVLLLKSGKAPVILLLLTVTVFNPSKLLKPVIEVISLDVHVNDSRLGNDAKLIVPPSLGEELPQLIEVIVCGPFSGFKDIVLVGI